MAVTAAKYITQVTILPAVPNVLTQILKANPRRWRVTFFDMAFGVNMLSIVPGPVPPTWIGGGNMPSGFVSEFPKEPSVTTGEWYTIGDGVRGLQIVECIYQGG